MKLIDEQDLYLKIVSTLLDPIVKKHNINVALLNTGKSYSSYLRNYLIYRYLPKYIPENKEVLFVNMYYWLNIFYRDYRFENGPDAGIEQQISGLIEEIANYNPDFNWQLLEKIKNTIDNGESL